MKKFIFSVLILAIAFQGATVFAEEKKSDIIEENVLEKSSGEKNPLLFSSAGWKNYVTAGTEIVVTNLLVYNFCTLILDQSWKKTNPKIMWENFTSPWLWDTSHFLRNQVAHPYFGNIYFTFARSNGLNFLQALLMTHLGSFLYENCIEAGRNSLNDFITTSFAGAITGEVFYRLGNEASRIHPLLGALFNPAGGFNSILTGRKSRTEKSLIENLSFGLGGGFFGETISIKKDDDSSFADRFSPQLYFNASVIYQNPYGHHTKEFLDQFNTKISGQISGNGYFFKGNFDGTFYSWPLYLNQNADSNFGLSLNYDVWYSDSNYLSLNSAGLFFKQRLNLKDLSLGYGLETNFIFLGTIENSYAESGNFFVPENFTYTFGPEAKLFVDLKSPLIGNLSGLCRLGYLNSYGTISDGKSLEGNFFILQGDLKYAHTIFKNLSLGIGLEVLNKIRIDNNAKYLNQLFFTSSIFVEYGF